jgi:hypothetical protein
MLVKKIRYIAVSPTDNYISTHSFLELRIKQSVLLKKTLSIRLSLVLVIYKLLLFLYILEHIFRFWQAHVIREDLAV